MLRTSHLVAMAAHAIVTSVDGRLLVIRRQGTGYLDGYWSLPAGHVDEGESAVAACVREVAEEVGIALDAADLQFRLVQQKSGADGEERVDFFFATVSAATAVVAAPGELDSVAWVTLDSLPSPFAPYVVSALDAIARGEQIAFWGL